ncbi:hypothetical protein O181_015353 [Austropuccinia psidii MF-1]|uniref:Uncharacterized protein n=1 Tax=Austropuccinia psidii MF-1 TaxID=1389203 RepID=A0A9Q3C2B9_9BASI|nr:hypothetical protein [Austropuccinia psidii MF-1]
MDAIQKELGMGNIWYYIPIWTIFPQKHNGETFKTQFIHFKARHHPPVHFERKTHLDQVGDAWWNPQYHLRTPTTWTFRCWLSSFKQYSSTTDSRGCNLSKSVVKASRIPELLLQLNWDIQAVFRQPVCHWPFWANSFSTVGMQGTQFTSQDGRICIDPKQSIKLGDQPSRISLQPFTYTGHLFFHGDFFPI